MKREDLQTGMILEFNDNSRAMVIRSVYGGALHYTPSAYAPLDILPEDLSCSAVTRILKSSTNELGVMIPSNITDICEHASEVVWERTVYPKWFESSIDKSVVKFTSPKEGTVVVKGCYYGSHDIGYSSRNIIPHTNAAVWEEVPEPVVYPKWFKHTKSDLVVKFRDACSGTVVIPNKYHKVGTYSGSWLYHNDPSWEEVSEPVKELTMAELEETLGYKVKITGNHITQ